MKKMFKIRFLLILLVLVPWGCEDELEYMQKEPEWLGPSIYEYLEKDGRFTNYMALLNQTDYKDILSRTGSRTLFVPDDSAFNVFYKTNKQGIQSVKDFSPAMVNALVKAFMLNNAIVSPLLTYPNARSELSLRRYTAAFTAADSILTVETMDPQACIGWEKFQYASSFKFGDNFGCWLPYFLQRTQDYMFWTDEDMETVLQGTWDKNDFYVLQTRVKQRDITCKNGYINVLSAVSMPPVDMYHWVRSQPNLTIFAKLLDRFSNPVYSPDATNYNRLQTGSQDSIWSFQISGACSAGIDIKLTEVAWGGNGYWNQFHQKNEASLFVPDDATLTEYFNSSFLKEFGSWDKVPRDMVKQLLDAHYRLSINKSVPSCFEGMKAADAYGTLMNLGKENVLNCGVCSNGLVYTINKVCAPTVLESVVAPILSMDNGNLWNIIVYKNKSNTDAFSQILSSTDYPEGFSVLITPDEYMKGWFDPVSNANGSTRTRIYHNFTWDKTWNVEYAIRDTCIDSKNGTVNFAKAYNNGNHNEADSKSIRDKLIYIGKCQMLVGDIQSGDRFYHTLNNQVLEVSGNAVGMQVAGGGNTRRLSILSSEKKVNGTTYVIDGIVQSPMVTPYATLSTDADYTDFYALLTGASKGDNFQFFAIPSGLWCVDYNVTLFTGSKYTIFAPSNQALQEAHQQGLYKTWAEIAALGSLDEQKAEKARLMRFLKAHFMDDCVYIGNATAQNSYSTAALNAAGGAIDLKVATDRNKITLTDPKGNVQEIQEIGGKTNVLTSEYTFDGNDYRNKLIKGCCAIVIHKIDKPLVVE